MAEDRDVIPQGPVDAQGFISTYLPPPGGGGVDGVVEQLEPPVSSEPAAPPAGLSLNEMLEFDKRMGNLSDNAQQWETNVNKDKQTVLEKSVAGQKGNIDQLAAMRAKMAGVQPPKAPNLPAAPQQQFRDPFQAWQNPAVAFAALASLLTRSPMIAAFKAGAAAIEGFHNGDKEVIKQNVENWKNETERALEQYKMQRQSYDDVYNKFKDDRNALIAEMTAAATVQGDEIMLAEIRNGANPERMMGIEQQRQNAYTKLREATARAQYYLGRSGTGQQGAAGGSGLQQIYDGLSDKEKAVIDRQADQAAADPKFMNTIPARDKRSAMIKQLIEYRREQRQMEKGTTVQQGITQRQQTAANEAGLKQFTATTPSSAGGKLLALNNASEHAVELEGAIDALKNKDNTTFNLVKNSIAQWSGKPAPTNFQTVKLILMDEIARYIVPGVGSQKDREEFQELQSRSASPAQLTEGLEMLRRLIAKQTKTFHQRYEVVSNQAGDFSEKFLGDEARKIYDKYKDEDPRPAAKKPAAAAAPTDGKKDLGDGWSVTVK